MDVKSVSTSYLKITVDKQERQLLVDSLAESTGSLSPTGMFLMSVLSEKNNDGGTEFTLGVNGVKDVLQDLDYNLRNYVKPPVVILLTLHLQYFLMSEGSKMELLCSDS